MIPRRIIRNYDSCPREKNFEASCAQGAIPSSARRKICRVVLTLNHSKRTNGPLVELNERVNSEKSAMRVAQCNARHASWIEEERRGVVCWKREFEVRFAALAPHVSPTFLPMRHFDAIWDERGCPSFRQYPLLFSLLPFRFNRPPLYSVTLYSLFLFFFFSIGIYRVVFSFCGCSSWIDLWNIGATIPFLSIPCPSRRPFFIRAAMTARVYVDRHNGRFMANELDG